VKISKSAVIKGVLLVLFVIAALIIYRQPAVQEHLSRDAIEGFIDSFGIYGPVIFVLIFALSIMLLVPGTVFTIVGALLFGPWMGTLLNVLGATLGAVGAFFIARHLGRDFVEHIIGSRFGAKLKRYDEKLQKHGFATIFYLRVTFFPLSPLNYAAGLTKVSFRDYFFGTLLGIIPVTLILTFFIGKIAYMHTWKDFFAYDILLVIVVFVLWLFIPKILKHIMRLRANRR
jgi:uncharacterized membrane protein YdjX (TVP38/TMEM64 family)